MMTFDPGRNGADREEDRKETFHGEQVYLTTTSNANII